MDRNCILAGSWYPASTSEIDRMVGEFVELSPSPVNAIGVMVPHAGWIYSGKIAGQVYGAVVVPDSVIVIAPNHAGVGEPEAVWDSGRWKIPYGFVEVDEQLASMVIQQCGCKADTIAHLHEHSLEIQLPFLWKRNPAVKIVPICVMHLSYSRCKEIGEGIAEVVKASGKNLLVVASSDMSHYISADRAKKLDWMAIEKMEKLDPEGLYNVVHDNNISMCGVIPATIMLTCAVYLGATEAKCVAYGSSGDVTGDYREVVGYASFYIK